MPHENCNTMIPQDPRRFCVPANPSQQSNDHTIAASGRHEMEDENCNTMIPQDPRRFCVPETPSQHSNDHTIAASGRHEMEVA
ncbi:hypothetical protein DPV78_009607 [Talaromyces pinophilus]|nr:hypothetical protein DPV78_009607 [Talaromyces pinophilus]